MKQVSEFNYSANITQEVLGDITVRVEPIEDSVAQASFSIEKNGEDLVTGRIISDRGYDIDEGVSNSYREQEWQSYVDSVVDEDEVDLIHAILKMAYVVANEPAKGYYLKAYEDGIGIYYSISHGWLYRYRPSDVMVFNSLEEAKEFVTERVPALVNDTYEIISFATGNVEYYQSATKSEPAKPIAIEGQETLPLVDELLNEGCGLNVRMPDPDQYEGEEVPRYDFDL